MNDANQTDDAEASDDVGGFTPEFRERLQARPLTLEQPEPATVRIHDPIQFAVDVAAAAKLVAGVAEPYTDADRGTLYQRVALLLAEMASAEANR